MKKSLQFLSHRPSILNLADKILVIKDGMMVAFILSLKLIGQVQKLMTGAAN